MNTEFGSAALARNVDDDVYDFSGVADPKDREMLIRTEQRLCRSYPYPPATFEEVALMCKTQFLELTRRTPEGYAALKARMIDTTTNWKGVDHMIRNRFFGVEKHFDEQEKKWWTPALEKQQFAWVKNEFPYLLEPEISHWLLWMSFRIPDADIDAEVSKRVPADSEYVFAPQKAAHMTIPAIFHVQVFFRRRK